LVYLLVVETESMMVARMVASMDGVLVEKLELDLASTLAVGLAEKMVGKTVVTLVTSAVK